MEKQNNDPQCQEYIEKQIKDDVISNDNGTMSPSTLRDDAEAVLRGKLHFIIKKTVKKPCLCQRKAFNASKYICCIFLLNSTPNSVRVSRNSVELTFPQHYSISFTTLLMFLICSWISQ